MPVDVSGLGCFCPWRQPAELLDLAQDIGVLAHSGMTMVNHPGDPSWHCDRDWCRLVVPCQWGASSGFPRILQFCQCRHPHLQRSGRPSVAHIPVQHNAGRKLSDAIPGLLLHVLRVCLHGSHCQVGLRLQADTVAICKRAAQRPFFQFLWPLRSFQSIAYKLLRPP